MSVQQCLACNAVVSRPCLNRVIYWLVNFSMSLVFNTCALVVVWYKGAKLIHIASK